MMAGHERGRRGAPARETHRVSDPVERELRKCLPRLFGYAISLTGDPETAQDLLQDCAVRAFAAASHPAEPAALRAWFFRILRNAWIDQYRRDRYEPMTPADEPAVETWRCDAALIDAITVRQGLARLSPAYREVIALVDLAGFAYAEAARILGVPVGTVMSRLSRARQALLAAIGESNVRPLPTKVRTEA
jgi:RNA polymerase sigma-70 factor (ECF subfamily)